MKKLVKTVVALMISFCLFNTLSAQELDKATVQNLVNNKNFVFKAQTVLPGNGGSRQLTTEYDMRVLGDSVVTYLPYFGRAYNISIGEEGGINFTSTQFEYKVKTRKKGGWDIVIVPKDTRDVRQLNLIVSEAGYATLQIISNNRQFISYTGYIAERR